MTEFITLYTVFLIHFQFHQGLSTPISVTGNIVFGITFNSIKDYQIYYCMLCEKNLATLSIPSRIIFLSGL